MEVKKITEIWLLNIFMCVALLLATAFFLYMVKIGSAVIEHRRHYSSEIKEMTSPDRIRQEAILSNTDFIKSLESFQTCFLALSVVLAVSAVAFGFNSYCFMKIKKSRVTSPAELVK